MKGFAQRTSVHTLKGAGSEVGCGRFRKRVLVSSVPKPLKPEAYIVLRFRAWGFGVAGLGYVRFLFIQAAVFARLVLGGSWDLISKAISTMVGVISTMVGVVSTMVGVV